MSADLRTVPLQELREHPDNPRRHFDELMLADLANSIREHGVLNPLLVRHKNGEGFQILAGARRFRAATLAGVDDVPVIVRDLNDKAALEVMIIDNLQREDVHPLEEAEGYAALMKQAGYDVAQIAGRIGKSEKYVYDRVKLLQLVPEGRKIFLDGEISAGHAILLARLSTADQQRCIGGKGRANEYREDGGVFEHDHGEDAPGLKLDDPRRRKARSVRELETWINDNVRFKPEEEDLPHLFPETGAALAAAAGEELKIVKITRDHFVQPEARDGDERTYFPQSWKRADGKPEYGHPSNGKASKPCEHSVLGVVVAGPGRGEAFRVCVAKKKCRVHWAAEIKEAEQHSKNGTASASAPKKPERDRYEEQRRREDEERARWKRARPQLLEALGEKLRTTPALDLVDIVLERVRHYGESSKSKHMERGKTLEDAMRFMAFLVVADTTDDWGASHRAPPAFKKIGIDARKIVRNHARPPKEVEAEKAGAGKEKGARARRRAKKVQPSAEA